MAPERLGRTVLVVEDDEAARRQLAELLGQQGYGVLTAAHGEEALRRLRSDPAPDVMLLDMLMPILDGWHLLERLRQEGPAVPVIVTTGTILTREWAESHGCHGFVHKPIEPDALLQEIRRCLG